MLLRYEEAAVRLGVSIMKLRSLINDGYLKKTQVGVRSVRIDEDEIKRYVESSRVAEEKS